MMEEQTVNNREIDRWIVDQTPQGGRVLDVGCGDGDLLALLVEKRQVRGTGFELQEKCVVKAVQRGLSVHHGDVEEGLDHYGDGTFDIVIMSLTIQELTQPLRALKELFRVGKRVIVVFPNFAYWRSRRQLALEGRAPHSLGPAHRWYDSTTRHFLTIGDWEELCREQGWRIVAKGFLAAGRTIGFLPNLRAEVAMYILEARQSASTHH